MVRIVVLLIALASFPSLAQAQSPPAEVASTRNEGHAIGEPMWMAGLTVFAASYALTGISATTLVVVANGRDGTIPQAWIPVVGPWLMLADSAGYDGLQVGLTVVSGILQLLGAGALVAGLVLDSGSSSSSASTASTSLLLSPMGGPSTLGLVLSGTF